MSNELACGPLDVFFRGAAAKGVPLEELTRGVGYPLDHLQKASARIDWDAAVVFFRNAERHFSDEELEELGYRFLSAPLLRKFAVIPRLLFTIQETYHWLSTSSAGAGMNTAMKPHAHEPGPGHFVLRLRMEPGFQPSRPFFLVSKGIMRSIPVYLGQADAAQVDMQEHADGVTFDIKYPMGGGRLSWLRRLALWPLAAFRVARELDVANKEIFERTHELAMADQQITFQGRQLHTAYEISRLVNEDVDPQAAAEVIARHMVEWGGLRAVAVSLDTVLTDRDVVWHSEEGAHRADEPGQVHVLRNRGERTGTLTVWGAEDDQKQALVELLLPTVEMALAHAIQFDTAARQRSDLERQLALRTRELKNAKETHRRNLTELEDTVAARERFFADINHEIRNPLSLSLLCLDQLDPLAAPDPDAARRLQTVREAHHQVLDLVDRMLHLAADTEADPVARRRRVDLGELLARLARSWEAAAKHAGVTLTFRPPDDIVVRGDEKELGRVFANLISNALKFTPAQGTVSIEARTGGDHHVIDVRDSGVGIAEADKARIFERFVQGPEAVRPGARGSGIGLAIVRELVEQHGGDIAVHDAAGGGSIFRVRLPVAADQAPVAAPPAPPPGPARAPEPRRLEDRSRVLVAEDNDAMRAELAALLSPRYDVITAQNGHVALVLAEQHRPDLLLSDVEMPLMNGLELAQRFRRLPGNQLRPVLLLTARPDVHTVRRGFEAGAVDYIRKPVNSVELLARIEAQLQVRQLAARLADRERLGALGLLVSSLAHEIRNPVNGVANAIAPLRELLPALQDEPDHPANQLLDVVEVCAEQLRSLAEQLLGFAHDDGLALSPTPLGGVLDRARSIVHHRNKATINLMLSRPIEVMASRSLLTQVFVNLFENAIDARADTTIDVHADLDDEHVVIEISDDGPGIPPALRSSVFDPFFTTKGHDGTGLGLHTVRQVLDQHRGHIELIDLGTGPGTHFRITLPRVPPAATVAEEVRP